MIIKITKENQKFLAKGSGFVIFLAFDIIGSTKLKYKRPNNWMFYITDFFETVRFHFNFNNHISNGVVWKEIGDEIIIAFFPLSLNDLSNIMEESIRSAFEITKFRQLLLDVDLNYKTRLFCAGYTTPTPFAVYNINEKRSDFNSYKKLCDSSFGNHRSSRTILPSKSKKDGQPSSCKIDSIKQYDFIGPDIDIGFRIGKNSITDQLIVSDKVAYLYSILFSNQYSFVLLNSKRLKGVWEGKPYPNIIYSSNINSTFINDLELIYNELNILDSQKNFIQLLNNVFNIENPNHIS